MEIIKKQKALGPFVFLCEENSGYEWLESGLVPVDLSTVFGEEVVETLSYDCSCSSTVANKLLYLKTDLSADLL